jgi:homoserine kinase
VFSVALESPHIEVEFDTAPSGTRTIMIEGVHAAEIDTDPTLNAAGKALSALADTFGKPDGYVLRMRGEIPPGKGLGLSGAEAVGAVLCANRIFRLGLDGLQLVQMAGKGEPSHHLDNVSASALGGFNIVTRSSVGGGEVVTTIPPPKDLGVAVLVPAVEKPSTEIARRLVPFQIHTTEHVRAMGHAGRISAAFAKGDVQAILETVPWDGVVEFARANGGLYGAGVDSSYLWEEKRILLEKFHVAETISGAGPSRALWYSISENHSRKRKNRVGTIQPAIALVTDRLRSLGYEVNEVFVTRPSSKGATIIPSPRR